MQRYEPDYIHKFMDTDPEGNYILYSDYLEAIKGMKETCKHGLTEDTFCNLCEHEFKNSDQPDS